MRYPIFVEQGDKDHAYGVVVPDLPGCFSAGDTLDEALDNARDAIAGWLESQLDHGEGVPPATLIDAHLDEFKGWIPAIVEVDLDEVLGKPKRVNISLPQRVLRRLDAQASRANVDRSAYISKLAMASVEVAQARQATRADTGESPKRAPLARRMGAKKVAGA